MSPMPGAPWPYYEPEPPTRICIADRSLIHEGNEIDECEACQSTTKESV